MAQNFLSDIKLGDNIYIRLGDRTFGDLNLYHNGTNSFIDNHTGNVYIRNFSDDKNIHLQSDDGSGGMTDYIVVHGSENIVKFQEHTRHLDNKEARFGTGSDLKILHDGTNSVISNQTGDLQIINNSDDKDIVFFSDDGSGSITEYFRVDGDATNVLFSRKAKFSDNVEAVFGDGADLQIYHNGTNSIINDNGTGNLQFQIAGTPIFDVTSNGITMAGWPESDYELQGDIDGGVRFDAQAGEALSKGDVVYISGAAGDNTVVSKAQANSTSTMPAFGLVLKDAANGASCQIVTFGNLYGSGAAALDTSTCTVGDEIFVSAATAGEWTKTAPTGESNLVQKIGKILRVATSNGVIKVSGAGRSNATPNLNTGRLFVGNASNQAVADGTMYVDIANSRVGIGTSLPAYQFHVENTSANASIVARATANTNSAYLVTWNNHSDSGNNMQIRSYGQGESGTVLGNSISKANYIWSSGDSRMVIGTLGSTDLIFGTGNAERMRIDSSGNTTFAGSITTTSTTGIKVDTIGNALLELDGASNSTEAIIFSHSGTEVSRISHSNSTNLVFSTGSSTATALTLDSSQNAIFEGTVRTKDTVRIFKPSQTSQNTYSAAAGLQLHSQQSVSGSPYTKTSDIVANADGTVQSELRLFTKGNGDSTPSERLRITSGGNVGIGVNDPDAKLEIKGTGATTGLTFKTTDSSSNETFYVIDGGRVGVRYYPLTIGIPSGTTSHSSGDRLFVSGTGGDVVISSEGNLGLGAATDPGRKLHIDNTASAATASAYFYTNAQHTGSTTQAHVSIYSDHASSTGQVLYARGDGTGDLLYIAKSTNDRFTINHLGNTTINASAPGNSLLTLQYNSTQDSPATVDNGDIIGAIHFKGIDDSASSAVTGVYGKILATADGLWDGSGNRGIDLSFHTGKYSGGSVSTAAALTLDQNQNATFAGKVGIGSAPSTRGLEVSGAGALGTILASDGTVNTVLWGDASGSNHGGVGTDNNYGFNIYQNGGVAIEIDTSKNATFEGDVIAANRLLRIRNTANDATGINNVVNYLYFDATDNNDNNRSTGLIQTTSESAFNSSVLGTIDSSMQFFVSENNFLVKWLDVASDKTATFAGDVTATSKKFISTSSSSGDYVRLYAGSGTGEWDIYGNGNNLRFSENSGVSGAKVVVDTDLQVDGDLIVTGTSTSVNVEDLNVEQGEITLNYAASSDTSSSADGAGIRIQDAVDASNDATMSWVAARDAFSFSHPVIVNATSQRDTSNPAMFSVQGGMSEFETTLTNNDDWQNSPISILERDNIGTGSTAGKYSPNLNFHWSGIVSRSLWMDASGNLNYGEYDATGSPGYSNGFIRAHEMQAGVFKDKDSTGYYLDPASTSTSLNVAGSATFAGDVTLGNGSSETRTLTLQTNAEKDSIINFKESTATYGFSIGYYGVANDFIIKRHDNSTNGTDVLTFFRENDNATFAGTVTATKLISTGGVLDLDDNGDADGVVNARASLTLNIDSDANSTGEVFRINSNTTGVNTNNLFNITETGAATFAGTITSTGPTTIKSIAGSGQESVLNFSSTNVSGFGSTYAIDSKIRSITADSSNAYASELQFFTSDTSDNVTLALTLDESQNATFAGTIKGTTYLVNHTSAAGIGASLGDINSAELGPGYLSLSRDDTADAKQIVFEKNDVEHSYIQTTTDGLEIKGNGVHFSTDNTFLSNYNYTFRDAVGIANPNSLSAATSSTTAMAIGSKSGGNINTSLITTAAVGIGTDNPSSQLHVSGANTVGRFVSSSAYVDLIFQNSGGTGGFLNFNGTSSFNVYVGGGSAANNKMTVLSSGNVGVGTTSPQEKLHIFNDSASWNEFANIRLSTESDSFAAEVGFHRGTTNNTNRGLFLSGDGTNKHLHVGYTGLVGIGTDTPASIFHVASATNPVLRVEDTTNSATVAMYATDSNLFMGAISNHSLAILTNDTPAITIDTSQNATFAGNVTAGDDLTLDNSSPEMYFKTGSAHYNWMIAAQENIDTALEFTPANAVGDSGTHDTPALTLYANRAATFAGNVTAGNSSTAATIRAHHDDGSYVDHTGYGMVFARNASYLRPNNDGARTMYFGQSSLTWNAIVFDSNSYSFQKDGSEYMQINSSGSIGVAPGYNGGVFAINGSNVVDTNWGLKFQKTANVDDYNVRLQFYPDSNSTRKLGFYDERNDAWLGYWDGSVASNLNWIFNSGGNVGIGTNSPTTGKLVVHSGDIEVRDSTGNSGGRIKSYDQYHSIYFREGGANKTNYYQYGGTLSAGLGHRFLTGGTSQSLRMQIADDGIYMANNVGIGTDSPGAKLQVNGNVKVYSSIGSADSVRTGLGHYDTTAQGAGVGGQLVLGYKYTDAGSYTEGAIIKMYKENGSSGNYASGLKFQVRNNGDELSSKMVLDPSGNVEFAGSVDATNFRDRDNTSYSLTPDSAATGQWQVNTPSGNVRIGPGNTTYSHFSTDRSRFYMNKQLVVDEGIISSYNEDLRLRRTESNNDSILITDTDISFILDGAEDMRLQNDGDLHVEGDVIAYSTTVSDNRLKDNVLTLENSLDKVSKLRGVEYTWNNTSRKGQKDIGVIAQEVEEVIPEIVREKKMSLVDGEKYKTVDYEKLTAVLIEAVKELKEEVEQLKNKCNDCTC